VGVEASFQAVEVGRSCRRCLLEVGMVEMLEAWSYFDAEVAVVYPVPRVPSSPNCWKCC
jgi:hypothetical protein